MRRKPTQEPQSRPETLRREKNTALTQASQFYSDQLDWAVVNSGKKVPKTFSNMKIIIFQLKDGNSCKYSPWYTRKLLEDTKHDFIKSLSVESNGFRQKDLTSSLIWIFLCFSSPAFYWCLVQYQVRNHHSHRNTYFCGCWQCVFCRSCWRCGFWWDCSCLLLSKSLVLVSVAIKSNKSSTSCNRIHTKISVQALFRSPSQSTIVGA